MAYFFNHTKHGGSAMTTRELASEYRMAQWGERLREQKASGQNIRQWCEENGIGRQRYFYWQRKLRKAASEQLPSIPTGDVSAAELCMTPSFARVRMTSVSAPIPIQHGPISGQVQIEVNGVKLAAGAAYPAHQLAHLIRELAGLC
jgi:hypothetical protein